MSNASVFPVAATSTLPTAATTGRLQDLAHRLKSSAAKLFMPPGGRRAPLLFDALESRLLLSATPLAIDLTTQLPAQQDHQVLVRLVDTVQQTQTTAATQQRIEIVDQASGTVLASSDAGNTSNVAIAGGAGNDQLTIDGASWWFASSGLPR